jgi:hypothetical protein
MRNDGLNLNIPDPLNNMNISDSKNSIEFDINLSLQYPTLISEITSAALAGVNKKNGAD